MCTGVFVDQEVIKKYISTLYGSMTSILNCTIYKGIAYHKTHLTSSLKKLNKEINKQTHPAEFKTCLVLVIDGLLLCFT